MHLSKPLYDFDAIGLREKSSRYIFSFPCASGGIGGLISSMMM